MKIGCIPEVLYNNYCNTTWFNVSQLDGVTNKTEGASLVYDWLLDNTTNVKNMYLHRDSNPGPWNTVPML